MHNSDGLYIIAGKQQAEDEIVDVTTVDEEHFGSSDEEPCEDELIYLPTTPLEDPVQSRRRRRRLQTASAKPRRMLPQRKSPRVEAKASLEEDRNHGSWPGRAYDG